MDGSVCVCVPVNTDVRFGEIQSEAGDSELSWLRSWRKFDFQHSTYWEREREKKPKASQSTLVYARLACSKVNNGHKWLFFGWLTFHSTDANMEVAMYSINIFIPIHLFRNGKASILYGYAETVSKQNIINLSITSLLPIESIDSRFTSNLSLFDQRKFGLHYLGQLSIENTTDDDDQQQQQPFSEDVSLFLDYFDKFHNNFIMDLCMTNFNYRHQFDQIRLESLRLFGSALHDLSHVTFVYYDTDHFLNSRLLNQHTGDISWVNQD